MKIGINQKKVKKERHTQIDKLLQKKAKTFNYHIVLDILQTKINIFANPVTNPVPTLVRYSGY